MSAIALNVAPIFILILFGWALARSGVLKATVGDGLGDFVFKIALPVLIFRTLVEADFNGLSPFRLWASYFCGVGITWTTAHLIATRIFKRDVTLGVIAGISSSFANNVFIGLPLVGSIIGHSGLVPLSILLAIHLPIMMIIGTILMENAKFKLEGGERRSVIAILKQVGRNLVTNPLVIAMAAGVAVNFASVPLTTVGKTVLDQIAGIAGPAALISLGMGLTRYSVSGNIGLSAVMTLLKLFLMPAGVWLAAHFFGLPPTWALALVLTSCLPTGVNSWLLATRFNAGQSLAASTITMSTLFGVLSVSFWAWLLM
ncbi:AEC family transporter [Rhizobiaceae bacterium BDR2-2]|uniref:AEC family transporter n=1 Tax=Ectorhizobium quercum TaxID=2965071 RepID=A0AAE3MWI1_9HYPH|nr:AEC family transporter [Ectorhizobium quercum]MCX8995622.1 AEC family transporter [Ectorhizobium quercum]